MDTYKLKFTQLQEEIFRLLCRKAGSSLNQRTIAKLLRVSPTAVAKALPFLEKTGFVKRIKHGKMNLVTVELNRDQRTMQLKRVENLRLIYRTGFSRFLEDSFPGATIILFGSFSRGDDTINSDIDLAIIGSPEKNIDFSSYEKLFEREVRPNFYPSLKQLPIDLRENLCNGIVLAGGIRL